MEEYGRYLDKLAAWIDTSRNPNMQIFLSEWNLSGTDMRTGLFAGGFLNRLERTPRLAMAAPALFLRSTWPLPVQWQATHSASPPCRPRS